MVGRIIANFNLAMATFRIRELGREFWRNPSDGIFKGEDFVPDPEPTTFPARRVTTVAFEDADVGGAEEVKGSAGKIPADDLREPSSGNWGEAILFVSETTPLKNDVKDDAQPVETVVLGPVWGESQRDDLQSRNQDTQTLKPRSKTTHTLQPVPLPMCRAIMAHCVGNIAHVYRRIHHAPPFPVGSEFIR